MIKVVGVTHSSSLDKPLKQELLYFDQVAVIDLNWFIKHQMDRYLAKEFEWLSDQGLVYEPQISLMEDLLQREDFRSFYTLFINSDDALNKEHKKLIQHFVPTKDGRLRVGRFPQESDRVILLVLARDSFLTRCIAIQFQSLDDLDAISLLPIVTKFGTQILTVNAQEQQVSASVGSDIVHIVLNELPVPDDTTPWEQIIEFRQDSDSQGKFLALRNWMREVAKASLKPKEIEEHLKYLLYDYRKHMELHRIKVKPGALETVITTTAEFVENCLKLNLAKAAKSIFRFKHQRIALLEAEQSAPGREVSYIIKAQEHFAHTLK